jgi:hypothetical protein
MQALCRLYEGSMKALLRLYGLRSAAPEKGGLRVVAEHALVPTMLDRAQQVNINIYILILLYMCPNTAVCVSSYSYVCVLILLYSLNGTLISP